MTSSYENQVEVGRLVSQYRFNRPVRTQELPSFYEDSTPDVDIPYELVSPEVYAQMVEGMLGHLIEVTRPVRGGTAFVDVGPDVRTLDLDALDDVEDLDEQVAWIHKQVTKPRTNLGSSGPPGRID